MILEQTVQEASNRYFSETDKANSYLAEIKEAVKIISDQETALGKTETNECLPEELDNLKEMFFLLESQNTVDIDYGKLFAYLEDKTNPLKEEYQQETEELKQESSIMSDEEAEKTVQKIQLSYLIGDKDGLSYEEKEGFHRWQEFNKTLLMLYHHLSPVCTGDVNYSVLN